MTEKGNICNESESYFYSFINHSHNKYKIAAISENNVEQRTKYFEVLLSQHYQIV